MGVGPWTLERVKPWADNGEMLPFTPEFKENNLGGAVLSAGQAISVFKDVVLAVAAFVGMLVAVSGLSTWNRQLKGSVEYELTRRLLKHTYRLREAIREVRHPFMSYGPADDVEGAAPMNQEQRKYQGLVNAYRERWAKVIAARDDLRTEILEGEVVWDDGIHTIFNPLFELQAELSNEIQLYLEESNPQIPRDERDMLLDIRGGRRSVMYDTLGHAADPFADEMKATIIDIESYLKPHLKK